MDLKRLTLYVAAFFISFFPSLALSNDNTGAPGKGGDRVLRTLSGSQLVRNDTIPPAIEFKGYHFEDFQAVQVNASTRSGGNRGISRFFDATGSEPAQNGWALLLVGSLMLLIGCATIRIFRKARWILCPYYHEDNIGNGRDLGLSDKKISINIS